MFHDIHKQHAVYRAKLVDLQMKIGNDPTNNDLIEKDQQLKTQYVHILDSSIALTH